MKRSIDNLIGLILLTVFLTQIGGCLCTKFGQDSKWCKAQTELLACAGDTVKNAAVEFAPAIRAILLADIETAKKHAQLQALLPLAGDAFLCVVNAVRTTLLGQLGGPPEQQAKVKKAIADAEAFLAAKKKRFK